MLNNSPSFNILLQIPYNVIEVNPLNQTELKWSSYKKVPVLKFGDEEVLVGSSAIMSRIAAEAEADSKNRGKRSTLVTRCGN